MWEKDTIAFQRKLILKQLEFESNINSKNSEKTFDLIEKDIENGEVIAINFETGRIKREKTGEEIEAVPFSDVQMDIYQKGGLLR